MLTFSLLAQIALPTSFAVLPIPGRGPASAAMLTHQCALGGVTKQSLLDQEYRLESNSFQRNAPVETLVHLGCVRAVLGLAGVLAKAGYAMPEGSTWGDGAQRILMLALGKYPDSSPAAEVLALVWLHFGDSRQLRPIDLALMTVVKRGTPGPATVRACTDLGYRLRDTSEVNRCATAGLRAGWDSTWHLLRLARISYDAADTLQGQRRFFAALQSARDSSARDEVRWQLQWFLSKSEMAAWLTMQPDSGTTRVKEWLAARDVRDEQPPGSRLAEHFKRLRYVEEHFGQPLSSIMKARVMNPKRAYVRWQDDYDDRAIVWLRYGAPTSTMLLPYGTEVWSWLLQDNRWDAIFHNEQFAGPGPTMLAGGDIQRLTQTDDNSLRPERTFDLAVRLYRFWNPSSGTPVGVFAFSAPLVDMFKSEGRVSAAMIVSQWDDQGNRTADSLLNMQLPVPKKLPQLPLFSGLIASPWAPHLQSWKITMTQGVRGVGSASANNIIAMSDTTLAMSDLGLGAPEHDMLFSLGRDTIPLSAAGAFDRVKNLTFFFQTRSAVEIASGSILLTVRRQGQASSTAADPDIKIAWKSLIPAGIANVTRSIDVSRLRRGRYVMEVKILDRTGRELAHRIASLSVQ